MEPVTVDLPPGVVRTGTEYSTPGRYCDANLWRWFGGASGPIGGWEAASLTAVSGKARAVLPWSDNGVSAYVAIGTHTHLYVMSRSGAVSDITPVGFHPGRADAIVGGGYGIGPYGLSSYGTPRPSSSQITPASVWSLDTWGDYLVGCMAEDGVIYEWTLNTAVPAVPVTNAPTARAILSTADRQLVALAAGGDRRRIEWSDRENRNNWVSTDTNYAGGFSLATAGELVTGRQIDGANLIWTNVDLWVMTFVGRPFGYGLKRRGSGCGAVSMNCMIVTDSGVLWMGANNFWSYNGYPQPLACDVQDHVFTDINKVQISKVYAVHNVAFGEVTWRYPSAESDEIDRYVTFNYREKHWTIGELVRLSGADAGVFPWPVEVGGDGYVYSHETGFTHGAAPFARTGPYEIGQGDRVIEVQGIVPDVSGLGDVSVSFVTHDWPETAAGGFGPYTLNAKTDARFTARSVSMTFTGDDGTDFRVGRFRLHGKIKGQR